MSRPLYRPGPASIEQGQAPDGLVIHIYGVPDGPVGPFTEFPLLLTRKLTPDIGVEELGRTDYEETRGRNVIVVAYDGDSGMRLDVAGMLGKEPGDRL